MNEFSTNFFLSSFSSLRCRVRATHVVAAEVVQPIKANVASIPAMSSGPDHFEGLSTINNGADAQTMLDEYVPTAKADVEDTEAIETIAKFSPQLQKKMQEMRSYASRYNIDLYRALKEAGGRLTQDGDGALAKNKFRAALLECFRRMTFSAEVLEEIFRLYGTGPVDTNVKRNIAANGEGRVDVGSLGHLEIKWIRFANSVGEHYDTYPPIDGIGSDGPSTVAH